MLTGPQILAWRDIFFRAFNASTFPDVLLSLDERLDAYAGSLRDQVRAVIENYNSRGMQNDLLAAALQLNPRNRDLVELAGAQRAVAVPTGSTLESIVRNTNSQLNFGVWLEKAVAIQNAVCRIELPMPNGGVGYGTGFLVAEDLVMTNWHVLAPLERNNGAAAARSADVRCRFDYRSYADGTESQGTVFSLAQDWRVLWSPNNPEGTEPTDNQLDCALVRIARPAGSLATGANPDAAGPPRGWIKLPSSAPLPFAPHTPLFIVQHPQARPIKLSLETDAITGMNVAHNRVRYTTNTEPGSSGSPCFDQNWNLIALHHSGEPNFQPTWNEGIPMNKIVALREQQERAAGGAATI